MGSCLKGKSEAKKHPGAYLCDKCGAVSDKKKHVCDPSKLKKKDLEKGKKKKK